MMVGMPEHPHLHILDPLGYLEFLSLEADATAVLTDSGGVKKKLTCLGVPCFTLRDNTKQSVTVRLGTNTMLGLYPSRIADVLAGASRAEAGASIPARLGRHAAERIAAVIGGDATGSSRIGSALLPAARDSRRLRGAPHPSGAPVPARSVSTARTWSARRSDSATSVKVGLACPAVAKTELPAIKRFLTECTRQLRSTTPCRKSADIRVVPR